MVRCSAVAQLAEPAVAAGVRRFTRQRPVGHLIVRPAAGAAEAEQQLPRLLTRELPNFMQPRAIHWRTAMPLNPNGKIDRTALAQELATELAA